MRIAARPEAAASTPATSTDRGVPRWPAFSVIQSVPFWLPRTSTWLYNQVRHLPAQIASHVVCDHTENLDQFPIAPIHVPQTRYPTWRDAWYRWRHVEAYSRCLLHVSRQCKAGLVHSHWGDRAYLNLPAVRRLRLPHVVTFYGKDVNYLPVSKPEWRTRYQKLFAHVDRVLCEGPHMAACIARLGCPEVKISVHRLGIEVDAIEFRPRRWLPEEPLRVLLAASFRQKKGIPDALAALGRVRRQGLNVEITIIGDASRDIRSHWEKERILQALETWQLRQCTRLLGYQPPQVLFEEAYRHHVFLSPSRTADDGDTEGGAPVTIIEMAATGMPIVSTTHCDIPSVILHGTTGLLAPEGDVETLAEHVSYLATNPQAWLPLLEASRKHVEEKFNVVHQARRLAEIYDQVR
jgi:colanic acid/amylovoran biosynthesis glycosyltransferase